MPVQHYQNTSVQLPAEGLERRIIHLNDLMTVIIDINNGPAAIPDPKHSHIHEQTSYIAKGEVLFFMEGDEPQHLKEGDMFYVPSGIPHCIQALTAHVRLVDSFSPIREDFLKDA